MAANGSKSRLRVSPSPPPVVSPAPLMTSALLLENDVHCKFTDTMRRFAGLAAQLRRAGLTSLENCAIEGSLRSGTVPLAAAALNDMLDHQSRAYSRRPAVKRLSRASARAAPPAAAAALRTVEPQTSPPSLAEVADVVGHSALVVTRPVEWGTVLLGFEQANRYSVFDASGDLVAHLVEEEGSLGRAIGRQLLRTRRPFTATVLNPSGDQIIFRLRRPAYLISSTIYVEDGEGNVVGEVQQRWHLWKRRYELFLGRRQFAAVDSGLLAWEFELRDERGGTLALIDRNFSGFGKELFTDAGCYVVHMGSSPAEAAEETRRAIAAAHPDRPPPPVTAIARARTGAAVIPTSTGAQLAVVRPLELDERMIALAAAISIDYDFFSRHSYGGGMLSPFVHPPIIPFPLPMGGAGAGAEAAEGAEEAGMGEGAAASGGATEPAGGAGGPWGEAAGGSSQGGGSGASDPLERDLGGDEWGSGAGQDQQSGGWGWGGGSDADNGDGGGGLSDFMGSVFGWGEDS